MKSMSLLISLSAILVFGCVGVEGPQGPAGENADLDKEVRFEIVYEPTTLTGPDTLVFEKEALRKFKKGNYALVDSATIGVYMNAVSLDENSYGYAELYDLNTGSVIDSSVVKTNSSDYVFLESASFYDNLSSSNRDLTIRIRADEGVEMEILKGYLFLYRSQF